MVQTALIVIDAADMRAAAATHLPVFDLDSAIECRADDVIVIARDGGRDHLERMQLGVSGRFLDVPLTVTEKGFSWGYNAGPLKVVNTMTLTPDGVWLETTESTYGSTPPRRSVEMRLSRIKGS